MRPSEPSSGAHNPGRLRRSRRAPRGGALSFAFGLAVLALLPLGCGASTYERVRDTWTREHQSYEALHARAFATATLKVEPFRRAFVEEYTRLFALTPEQRESLLENELDEDRRDLVTVISFYTPQPAWNDLNPARGIWEVRLETDRGDAVQPYSVVRLDGRNPTWRTLYPYVDPYHILYELRFERLLPDGRPLARSGERLSLVIAGAPTRFKLHWVMP